MNINRRRFLHVSAVAGGGLMIGFHLPGCSRRKREGDGQSTTKPATKPEATPATTPAQSVGESGPDAELNAWIHIATDGTITILVDEAEMGQGVLTSVPMVIAEELDADWSRVRSVLAPLDKRFGRQSTGGSTTIRKGYTRLRKAGAAGRAMLIGAAAAEWGVPAKECSARDSAVTHPSGKRADYGQLASRAATIEPPDDPPLKPVSEFRLIGKSQKRLDTPAKINGTATYGIDVKLDDMLVASVEHSPIFGGKVASFDASEAKKVDGVVDVMQIPTGIAVVARHFWAAQNGRKALKVTWDDAGWGSLSTDSIRERCKQAMRKSSIVATDKGSAETALKRAAHKLHAVYEVPYLAHAPMEPLNCTARVSADACELWVPTQSPSSAAKQAADITGLSVDKIQVNTMMLGGGFGRRSQTDFVADAVHVAKAVGKPVKVVWTREDDIRAGHYRPYVYNEIEADYTPGGWPSAWRHQIAGPSILDSVGWLDEPVDPTSVEGASNMPYGIDNVHVTSAMIDVPIPIWFWRSVGSSQNAFVTECFADEVARACGQDPLAFRQKLLADKPRHKRVLETAAHMAGWGSPAPAGTARGIAVHESFGSFVAQVAEVSMEAGKPRVHRVYCAIDCGVTINPDTIVAQMESGIMYGLSAALYGEIAIENGRARQSNFHDYKIVRMSEAPLVETAIIDSSEPSGGVGEPGLPPVIPAVCNAMFALTGKPVRKLPIVG